MSVEVEDAVCGHDAAVIGRGLKDALADSKTHLADEEAKAINGEPQEWWPSRPATRTATSNGWVTLPKHCS